MRLDINLTFSVPNVGDVRCVGTIEDTDSDSTANPAARFAEWLASIDPTELEAATMAASDYSTSPTVTMLAILKRWAGGGA